jgi:D-amino peptidase
LYYRLNQVLIGEFGSRALIAGVQSVPTIFLAGDDKAALEAKLFIPEIETVITKYGKGLEQADHVDSVEVCERIFKGAANAVRRMKDIPPFTGFQPPYQFEAKYYFPLNEAFSEEWFAKKPHIQRVDERTYRIDTDDLFQLPF